MTTNSNSELTNWSSQGEALPINFSKETEINEDSRPEFQLLQAAAGGHTNAIQLLLKQGTIVDINVSTKRGVAGDSGRTAVSLAAENGYDEIITLLAAAGADVNISTLMGYTPIFYAVARGNMQCVKVLIDAKADLEASPLNTSSTPLWIARDSSKKHRKNKQIDNSERFDAIAEVLVEAGDKQPKVNTCMIL